MPPALPWTRIESGLRITASSNCLQRAGEADKAWGSRKNREALPSALSTVKPYSPITRHQPSYAKGQATVRRCSGLFIHPSPAHLCAEPPPGAFLYIYIFILFSTFHFLSSSQKTKGSLANESPKILCHLLYLEYFLLLY